MGVLGKAARVIGAAALALRSVHSLQVEVIAGNRTCPATSRISADDGVQMRYTGTIHASSKTGVVGKEFDSSARLPGGLLNVTLGRGELVKGWERGLVDLCEGARATFVVEPELAYGDGGAGPDIPGGATLLFDVEVMKVRKAHNLFVEMDRDSDGRLDRSEMDLFFKAKALPTPPGEPKAMYPGTPERVWEMEDKDGNGYVTWREFSGAKGSVEIPLKFGSAGSDL